MKKKYFLIAFAFSTVFMMQTQAQLVATFEDLTLENESYWNGSNGIGSFTSGPMVFKNQYNDEFFSWSGFAYSNITDNVTPGYSNQYSAMPGQGVLESENYAVGYTYGADTIIMNKPSDMYGMFVANSTYAALSMQNGDEYSKKFGGTTGNDEDWFKLTITGWDQENKEVGIIEVYLADYRFSDNSLDYIIKNWRWIDLTSLINVSYLTFELSSSDNGDWGMNTPAFFCLDQVTINNFTSIGSPLFGKQIKSSILFEVSPNPTQNYLSVSGHYNIDQISITNLAGQIVFQQEGNLTQNQTVNLENLKYGIYFIKVTADNQTEIHKISKQ